MAATDYSKQFNYAGAGYVDAKMQPVKSIDDLNKIPRSQRFVGLTVTVLDDGSGRPYDYWIEKSVTKWVKKTMPSDENGVNIPINGNDVENSVKTQ